MCCFLLDICWHRIVTCSVAVCGVVVLLNREDWKENGKRPQAWHGRRNGKMDPEMGLGPSFLPFFHFDGHFGPGAVFHFLYHFPGFFLCRAGFPFPKGPKIEKKTSRLIFSISLEMFNLDLQNSPHKIGVWWVARLKISISLENFNPGGRS